MSELATVERVESLPQKMMQPQEQAMALIQAVASGSLTAENAKAAIDLAERLNAVQAKREFSLAFSQMQGELPRVVARHKADRYKYASMDDILSEIQPVLSKFGFSIRWGTEWDDKRITAICHLGHSSGHEEVSKFAVRISAAPGISPAQGDGSTLTYARRYALCGALNINIDKDNDGAGPRMEGGYITAEQAADLERRVKSTGRDMGKFLKFADAKSFMEIRQGKYKVLDDFLKAAERDAKPSTTNGGSEANEPGGARAPNKTTLPPSNTEPANNHQQTSSTEQAPEIPTDHDELVELCKRMAGSNPQEMAEAGRRSKMKPGTSYFSQSDEMLYNIVSEGRKIIAAKSGPTSGH